MFVMGNCLSGGEWNSAWWGFSYAIQLGSMNGVILDVNYPEYMGSGW